MSEESVHRPDVIFSALERQGVEYVTVGGLAVAVWAYERAIKDTDVIVAADDPENERRLTAALESVDARRFELSATIAGAPAQWDQIDGLDRWRTSGGILDVICNVEGAAPFLELRVRSVVIDTDGVPARYVTADDLIAMKVAAVRMQDVLDLGALLAPQNQQGARVWLREIDRDLLGVGTDPGLGTPVDPGEIEVD